MMFGLPKRQPLPEPLSWPWPVKADADKHEHWWQKRNPGYSTVCEDCGEALRIEEQVAYVHPRRHP